MRLQIFNCHHAVPDRPLTIGPFTTLVSGLHSDPAGRYLGDLDGANIAHRLEHSEMRQQYHVWKDHLWKYDYVGFEHYRRLFCLDPLPGSEIASRYKDWRPIRQRLLSDQTACRHDLCSSMFDRYLDMRRGFDPGAISRLTQWIGAHDVIVLRAILPDPIDTQWATTHMAEYWPILVGAVISSSYFKDRSVEIDFAMNQPAYCNMYILRAEIFDDYMRFWHEAVGFIASHITVYPRLVGHFAERLFNFYLMQKRMEDPLLKVGRLPYLFLNTELDAHAAA
ncbi:protein of unknown function [Acidiphilium rubrum]|jgi:hypothetical protein|uniref:DUF4422 domain-containing protein n=1 Tax=Acidiphilium rubrum TaxID=526 RepID=A0A8G2CIZ9_ACIRU|nr:protein of unknown function [Acidiphilium rubrum]